MKQPSQNFTIIVNWKKKGFGCAKALLILQLARFATAAPRRSN
ncbi:hypothetical protein [Janthinobacterium fluminis]|uniref:ESPR domain-containing protein n=1 Tax=Janthinobacterium fluminis TaxID=2987524 RepID=A0ABT5K7B8_9BURK|nr:hypothetical protein [Janthinobacterium fluminis]MDC8760686.1 hypothetical protein [Janthinobacterium fluminis]